MLTVTRNPKSYEEFYMVIYTGAGHAYYNTKDFSNCNSYLKKFEIGSAFNFIIKARSVNEYSNYVLNVHQENLKQNDSWIVIVYSFALTFFFIMASVFVIIFWVKIRRWQQRTALAFYVKMTLIRKNEYIARCLDNMRRDEYRKINVKFDQSDCIICLEKFEPNSEVWATNEWDHIFHLNCCKSWFINIMIRKDLTCPHWNTIITDNSEVPNDVLDQRSDELNTSTEFNTPGQLLHQLQQNNYFTLISSLENQRLRSTTKLKSGENWALNHYEDIDPVQQYSEEVKSTYDESDSA